MNKHLSSVPTDAEVKNALFSIHPYKAPGPDGFSACFFHSNWEAVGSVVTKEVQSFFRTGILPDSINETHVRLIPKIQAPKLVSDYRPIALCNVVYKLISKIITIRLKPILNGLISENQSAFVPGRAISDNVLITHEILHYLKNSKAVKHCTMAVKTDMSKAYDRLEWEFIRLVLARMGFCESFVALIMTCISTVSYSYLINDTALGTVIPSRGIRQGDPLSPYIFIICGEVLSGLCRRAHETGSMVGVRVAVRAPRVNHLLFADDTMFFLKSDEQSCSTLADILHQYKIASGQTINTNKSAITFSAKTTQETRSRVKQFLGIANEGGVGKYLGLPEHFGRRKRDLFTSIVDRIWQQAASWSNRFLSSAWKMTMLKAVLSASPNHAMSCFELPVNLCKRIQSVLTRFWWDANDSQKKMCWTSWSTMTKPKKLGGLGFRDIQLFKQALLAKQTWRIMKNPHCLLARVLQGKYCQKEPINTVKQPAACSMVGGGFCLEGTFWLAS